MIRKLRHKLIFVAMGSLLLVLLLILGTVNYLNYRSVVAEADRILTLLTENGGVFPEDYALQKEFFLTGKTSELPYTSRFFSVTLDGAGSVRSVNTEKTTTVDAEAAADYAARALRGNRSRGFLAEFRFMRRDQVDGSILFVFLDCTKGLTTARRFLFTCLAISAGGLAAVFLLLLLLSERIVRPISESYEKQKRFITDAGHELKTPLTIISADADVLEMEHGPSEWLQDIRLQTRRLTELTNDLIFLSKMEEPQDRLQVSLFSLSDLAEELIQSFQALARAQNKTFISQIQPGLSLRGDERTIGQLIAILLDNALKYSPPEGTISLTLEKRGRFVHLEVHNSTRPLSRDNLDRLFERFYRADPSRNSQTGGYGIGLSIAKAVTEAHRGEISAASPDGHSLTISVELPL